MKIEKREEKKTAGMEALDRIERNWTSCRIGF